MRGLAFPNAVYNREASYDRDHGTPQRNNADAIPIDPALSGTAIDPAITGEESRINEVLVSALGATNLVLTPERVLPHTCVMKLLDSEMVSDYLFV